MLDSVKDDPDFRRQLVYELARYKLAEQFTHADAKHIGEIKEALETAILEVERFSRDQPGTERASSYQVVSPVANRVPVDPPQQLQQPSKTQGVQASRKSDTSLASPILTPTTVAVLAIVGISAFLFTQKEHLIPIAKLFAPLHEIAQVAPRSEPTNTPVVPAKPSSVAEAPTATRALPHTYGVYADVGEGALVDLVALGMKPPDSRVAISAAFSKPDRPPLPHGRVKFIVYRRDTPSSIPERAEVRLVAKIARDFSPNATGRTLNDMEDSLVIRNVSFPFRVSPVPDTAEMYELRSETADLSLPAGRYVLIIKTQAYFFQIEGSVTDPRQCVERVVSTSGTYYSPCVTPR